MSELSRRARELSSKYRQTHQGLSTDARSSHLLFMSSAVDVSTILDDYDRQVADLAAAKEEIARLLIVMRDTDAWLDETLMCLVSRTYDNAEIKLKQARAELSRRFATPPAAADRAGESPDQT